MQAASLCYQLKEYFIVSLPNDILHVEWDVKSILLTDS